LDFGWFFFWNWILKNLLDGISDMDGLILYQSTSTTKLPPLGKVYNGKIALFYAYGIYTQQRRSTKGNMGYLRIRNDKAWVLSTKHDEK